MAFRRRYREDPAVSFVGFVFVIYFLFQLYNFQTNPGAFFLWLWLLLTFPIAIGYLVLVKRWINEKNRQNLIEEFKKKGGEEKINNFIDSFGLLAKKGEKYWKHGKYSFTDDEIDRFLKILNESNIVVKQKSDFYILLKYFIDQKEDNFMRETIVHKPTGFTNMSGAEFEGLLLRLYEAMGYSVMKTGRVGDQGCDLVVNMNSQRVVVQAKCYSGSVGNSAVQEANTALKLYNCTKAIVVTNSHFTPEAIKLALVNDVDLIDGQRLRELLLQYLKENWV